VTLIPIHTADEWRDRRDGPSRPPRPIGFVPTMGALHDGHAALIVRSRAENATTVVSIFVNPAQFNDPRDFEAYPRTLETDLRRLEDLGVDFVFLPDEPSLYRDGYRYRVTETDVSLGLCGAHRPGHFDGVLTAVLKLLNIFQPNAAYFGEKDYQQYRLVQGMAQALFLDVEIRPCPIVRESDGVALSSRNLRLSHAGRMRAAQFAHVLRTGPTAQAVHAALDAIDIEVEYVEAWEGRLLAAVIVDGVRLIDNVPIPR